MQQQQRGAISINALPQKGAAALAGEQRLNNPATSIHILNH